MQVLKSGKFEDETDHSVQCELETEDGHTVYAGFWAKEGHPNIVSISSQVGCRVRCKQICNVQRFKRDLTPKEVHDQVEAVLASARSRGIEPTDDFKVSMVKEGEPLLNRNFPEILEELARYMVPIKVSTTLPDSEEALWNMRSLMAFARDYPKYVQVQVSLGSTNREFRRSLTAFPTMNFDKIALIGKDWNYEVKYNNPEMSKIMLTFTIYDETPCSPDEIIDILPPDLFVVRVRDASVGDTTPDGMTRLTQEKFDKLQQAFISKGYKFIDGRSADLAVKNNLTIGLNKLGDVLKDSKPPTDEDCGRGYGATEAIVVLGRPVTDDQGSVVEVFRKYKGMDDTLLHASADELERSLVTMDAKDPRRRQVVDDYSALVLEEAFSLLERISSTS